MDIETKNLISNLQSTRDRLGPVLFNSFGDVFDGDMDVLLEAINTLKQTTFVRSLPRAWMPIETAPKDGTEILLARGYRVTYGSYVTHLGGITEIRDADGKFIDQIEDESFEGWVSADGDFSEEDPPTHWMLRPRGPG